MGSLRDLLHHRETFHVEPGWSVIEVVRKMSELRVGAILVLDGGRLCGLFSERDLMTRVVAQGRDPLKTPVGEVMSTELSTIDESASTEEAMETMHRRNCRHLPVTRDCSIAGMVSMRDLMNYELERKTEEIRHMRDYIAGNS
jgi:signal-transduction protein with cAMP-binding, CBS, and nucleotidyltransferase domain